MENEVGGSRRVRKSFGKIDKVIDIPNLIVDYLMAVARGETPVPTERC